MFQIIANHSVEHSSSSASVFIGGALFALLATMAVVIKVRAK